MIIKYFVVIVRNSHNTIEYSTQLE